jgi:hypothetical protein
MELYLHTAIRHHGVVTKHRDIAVQTLGLSLSETIRTTTFPVHCKHMSVAVRPVLMIRMGARWFAGGPCLMKCYCGNRQRIPALILLLSLAPQPSLGLGLLHKVRLNFLEASQQFSSLQGRVVSPTPNPHPGGPGLCIYIPQRQGGYPY